MDGSTDNGASPAPAAAPPTADERRVLGEVLAAIRSVQHGAVTLIVQDRRVVQIDRTEKRRLDR